MTKKPVKIPTISALWAAFRELEAKVMSIPNNDYFARATSKRIDALENLLSEQPKYRAMELNGQTVQQPVEQYCVIGDKAKHQYPISRTWHATQLAAERYAGSICRNQPNCEELLVVKVVSKVGRREPDIKITRV